MSTQGEGESSMKTTTPGEDGSPGFATVPVRRRTESELRWIDGSPKDAVWEQRAWCVLKTGGILAGGFVVGLLFFASLSNVCGFFGFLLITGLGIWGGVIVGNALWKRGAHLDCPYCGRKISSNKPWVCGKCGHKNEPKLFQTLFEKCGQCEEIPKAYVCDHSGCGQTVLLTETADDGHPAYAPGTPVPIRRVQSTRKDEQELEREEAEHQLHVARMEAEFLEQQAKIAAAKRQLEKIKHPPLPVDPVHKEVEVMLRTLKTQDEKERALREYGQEQEKRIKDRRLPPEEEADALKELRERLTRARAMHILNT